MFLLVFCSLIRIFAAMILEKLSLINYKNIRVANLELSPKINCLIGQNGVGKTNVLDALNQEEPLVVRDHLGVDGVTRRVTEREEVDGIQDISLAHTVLPDQTVDLRRQFQRGCLDVLVVDKRQFL